MCYSVIVLLLFIAPVLAELQQVGLVSSEECKGLYEATDLVRVQSSKSTEEQTKTANVLARHGFEKESNLLAGKQTQPLIHVPVVCCTVKLSCKGYLKASIIVSSYTQCRVIARGYQSPLPFHLIT